MKMPYLYIYPERKYSQTQFSEFKDRGAELKVLKGELSGSKLCVFAIMHIHKYILLQIHIIANTHYGNNIFLGNIYSLVNIIF